MTKKDWKMVRVRSSIHARLMEMKHLMRFTRLDAVIQLALKHYTEEFEIATYKNVMHSKPEKEVPILLTGLPGAGKTHFVRHEILPRIKNPKYSVLVIDTAHEYTKLQEVGIDVNLSKLGQKVRFLPNKMVEVSKSEVHSLFNILSIKREQLKNWIIIIEEAHRYIDTSVTDFVYECRKMCRKIIVITAKAKETFKGQIKVVGVHREV